MLSINSNTAYNVYTCTRFHRDADANMVRVPAMCCWYTKTCCTHRVRRQLYQCHWKWYISTPIYSYGLYKTWNMAIIYSVQDSR